MIVIAEARAIRSDRGPHGFDAGIVTPWTGADAVGGFRGADRPIRRRRGWERAGGR